MELNLCAKCKANCCSTGGNPVVTSSEVFNMERILGVPVPTTQVNVRYAEGSNRSHIRIKKVCPALSPTGCKLLHEERPVSCRLYPWIPYSFTKGEWTVLLDPARCENAVNWLLTFEDAVKELQEITKDNPEWNC